MPPGPGITIIECIGGYANTVLRSTYTPTRGAHGGNQIAWTVRRVWSSIHNEGSDTWYSFAKAINASIRKVEGLRRGYTCEEVFNVSELFGGLRKLS